MSMEKEYSVVVKGVAEQQINVVAENEKGAIKDAKEQFLEAIERSLNDGSFYIEEAKVEHDPASIRWQAFKKAVREYCLARDKNRCDAEDRLCSFEEELPVFDPLEAFQFKEICAVEVMNKPRKVVFSQCPLTDKRATLIDYYDVPTPYVGKMCEITEGYELWLLEDMTFFTTYFHQMRIGYEKEFEIHRYRSVADKDYFHNNHRFFTEYFLDDLNWKIDPMEDGDEN